MTEEPASSTSGLRVRPAHADDGAALREIDTTTWSSDVSPAPVPPGDAPFFTERTRPEDVLVCEADGDVAGNVSLSQDIS